MEPITSAAASPDACASVNRRVQVALAVLGTLVGAALLAHLAVLLWARHEFTQVESIVALHANMLANGQGLYYDLGRYPFTVAAYGPIFYAATAALHLLAIPLHQSARLISFTALAMIVWLAWRILTVLLADSKSAFAGALLTAASANLLFWGTTGQTDLLAFCFSLAAFLNFVIWREQRTARNLLFSGLLVVLAVFTKQTYLASGFSIAICLLVQDRKRALWWAGGVASLGLSVLLLLTLCTHGHFFEDAVLANINFYWVVRLKQHIVYFLTVDSGLVLVFLAGVGKIDRRVAPLYLYTALSTCIWLGTAPKIGSDLNYQIETVALLSLCCGWTLSRLQFFRGIAVLSQSWTPLLQAPLLLYVLVNLAITTKVLSDRVAFEAVRTNEEAQLAPFLNRKENRVISMQFDPLLNTQRRVEVEPLIYTLLVNSGRVDPSPVRNDLAAGRFGTIILFDDVFAPHAPPWQSPETLSLPACDLDQIRKHYRLVKHIPGPYLDGDYVYEPL